MQRCVDRIYHSAIEEDKKTNNEKIVHVVVLLYRSAGRWLQIDLANLAHQRTFFLYSMQI